MSRPSTPSQRRWTRPTRSTKAHPKKAGPSGPAFLLHADSELSIKEQTEDVPRIRRHG